MSPAAVDARLGKMARLMAERRADHEQLIHRGWHTRGYLPHFDNAELIQGITFRLADSLPVEVRESVRSDGKWVRGKVEAELNRGGGACWLLDVEAARIVEEALIHFDGERYRLLAWVVMPNHVHVVAEQVNGWPLGKIVHSWKSFTAKKCNEVLGMSGAFWARDYFDRFVRNSEQLEATVRYVHENPVKAELVERAEQWPWSSARESRRKDTKKEAYADGSY